MKQVTITTGKATIVVVDFAEDNTVEACRAIEAMFNVKWIGELYQLTEEDWKGIVDQKIETDIDEPEASTTSKDIEIVFFYDYVNKTFFGDCDTATESGLSLLKSNGVVMDYDFEGCPNDFCENGRIDMGYNESMTCSLCEEAQEQVWLNPQIFVKV